MSAILMYHDVTRSVHNPFLQVTPQSLERHLTWIREAGYRVASLQEVLGLAGNPLPGSETDRLVALTFDDGYAGIDLASRFFPPSAKPSVFVCSGVVGSVNAWATKAGFTSRLLDEQELVLLREDGWDIQCHGWDHGTFLGKSDTELTVELDRCLAWFADKLCVRPKIIAYPYGHCDTRVARVAARRFSFGLSVESMPDLPSLFAIPRITAVDHMTRPWLLEQISEKSVAMIQSVRGVP